MPKRRVPGRDADYYLVSFDGAGRERAEGPDGAERRLTESMRADFEGTPPTDVFVLSHGWKGDVPGAIAQYDAWLGCMLALDSDLSRARQIRPGFAPAFVGLHWPSQLFGNESIGAGGFAAPAGGLSRDALIERAAEGIVGTPAAREALGVIVDAALTGELVPDELPPSVVAAYATLAAQAQLGAGGLAGPPGDDGELFDAEAIYQEMLDDDEVEFGAGVLGGLLEPLRALSFWRMKKRARSVGETGGAELLRAIFESTPATTRVHLMGHSFGCIVTSAAVMSAGPAHPRRVSTLYLVQGALSLWSYCEVIPYEPAKSGWFHPIVQKSFVEGPIITTQSEKDTAVRCLYPLGAGVARMVDYDPGGFPKYAGLGTFGAQGTGFTVEKLAMKPATERYTFAQATLYNVESSHVIRDGVPPSGAHSDIARPEVWHVFLEAAVR